MKELYQHRTRIRSKDQFMLVGVLLMGFFIMILPSCEHEPLVPIDPDPGDTTMNPIDTIDIDTPGTPCDPELVYFSRDILPILKSNCAKSGCHDAITHEEGIILDNYENVMASGQVRPFNLDKSDLYEAITDNDPDKLMPPPPNQKLTAAQVTMISKWILQGAVELACDDTAGACDTTAVSYAGFVAPLLSTYCVGCHSGGSPSGNISLTSHPGVQALAMNGRLLGAITWANGYQQMPKGSSKLSDCRINKIKAWINDGAPNN